MKPKAPYPSATIFGIPIHHSAPRSSTSSSSSSSMQIRVVPRHNSRYQNRNRHRDSLPTSSYEWPPKYLSNRHQDRSLAVPTLLHIQDNVEPSRRTHYSPPNNPHHYP